MAFLRGLYKTFFTTKHKGFKAALDLWFSWGILVGHALLGYFAAASFVSQMLIAGYTISPVTAKFLKISLTILVTAFEGLSEAHAVKKLDFNFKQYSYAMLGFLVFCGFFHVLPSVTAGTWFLSSGLSWLSGVLGVANHFAGTEVFYNSLAMAVTTLFIWFPNWVGFAAMTAPTLDTVVSKSPVSFFSSSGKKHAKHDHSHKHSHDGHHHHHDHHQPETVRAAAAAA